MTHHCGKVAPNGYGGIMPTCPRPATQRVTDTADAWLQQYFCDEHAQEYVAEHPTCVAEPLGS